MKTNSIWQPLLLMAIGLIVIVSTYRDYGITWDESAQSQYAEYVLDYYQTGHSKLEATSFLDAYLYGPLFDLTAAAIYQHAPESKYEIRHFLIALTGLMTILIVYLFGRRLGSTSTGVYAALALAMMPRFYGHAFNNHKDIPFAAALALTLYALTRVSAFRASAWKDVLLIGLAAGAALAIRAGGMVILLVLVFCIFAYHRLFRREQQLTARFLIRALAAFVLAWCCMIAVWPWAQQSPISNPFNAMVQALSFPNAYPVFFEGATQWSNQLPRYYVWKFLLITVPLGTLALVLFGVGRSLLLIKKEPSSDNASALANILIWLFVPLTLVLLSPPNVYDGIRMFLFLLPAAALLAGYGAYHAVRALTPHTSKVLAHTVVTVLLLLPLIALVRLHPYQTTYYNAFVGGLPGASERYETEYWITSYKEAAEWINQRVAESSEKDVVVLTETSRLSLDTVAYYLDPAIASRPHYSRAEEEPLPPDVDYYVVTTRFGLDANFPNAPVLHAIGREGAVFAVIKGRPSDL